MRCTDEDLSVCVSEVMEYSLKDAPAIEFHVEMATGSFGIGPLVMYPVRAVACAILSKVMDGALCGTSVGLRMLRGRSGKLLL